MAFNAVLQGLPNG